MKAITVIDFTNLANAAVNKAQTFSADEEASASLLFMDWARDTCGNMSEFFENEIAAAWHEGVFHHGEGAIVVVNSI